MKTNVIPIVTASDEHYAPYLSVMIGTLLKNMAHNVEVILYIIDDNISNESKMKLNQIVENYSNRARLEFFTVNKHLYENFLVSDHITTTAYLRISLPKIFENHDYRKILYIDVDTLILEDVSQLYNTDLGENIIGAVIDPGQTEALNRLGIDSDDYYFNSGVMLIDIDRWNEHKITEKTLDFLKDHSDVILYHDQDALNAVLYEQWQPLHPKWNMQCSLVFNRYPAPTLAYEKAYLEGNETPAIVHFTGHDKPWNTLKNHPYQDLYMKKLAESPFYEGVTIK